MAKLIDGQFLGLEGGFLLCFDVGLLPAPGSVGVSGKQPCSH